MLMAATTYSHYERRRNFTMARKGKRHAKRGKKARG